MARNKNKKTQAIKIYGFPFPQQLLDDLRSFQKENRISIPASAYAALICVLKQIHREKTSLGELQEFKLSTFSKELDIPYSTLYIGLKFLEKHKFVYEAINSSGKPVLILHKFDRYHGIKEEAHNYFIVPHSLFETNIMAELVRTSNARVFELLFSLLTQFRHGIANVDKLGAVQEVSYPRNMSTLKNELRKRSKGVREAITLLEPLFNIQFVGLKYRQKQLWIKQVEFSLKPNTVIENNDAFEVHPLISEFSKQTEHTLNLLDIAYKPRDLFDIMVSFKHEVIQVLKYISKEDDESSTFSERDSVIQSYFYKCLEWFVKHISKLRSEQKSFYFSKSIGAYFRTIFRNHIVSFIQTHLSPTMLHEAKMREYVETGKVPMLYNTLKKS